VVGTVVETKPGDGVPHGIVTVVDMRDELSPLDGGQTHGHTAYSTNEHEGEI
jgi:hypothetical protein